MSADKSSTWWTGIVSKESLEPPAVTFVLRSVSNAPTPAHRRTPFPVEVGVVADRETTRAAIVHLLDADPELRVTGEASDVATALDMVERTRPRVAIVNLRLGGSDAPGIRFIAEAKARYPMLGILSLKRRVDEHLLRAALDAGADACCLATTSERRLRAAIKAVAEGATWLDPEISQILLHPPRHAPPRVAGTVQLSPREHDILRLVTEGYTNEEIAGHVGCAEATIKTHLLRLFRKLDVHDRVSAAVAGLRRGLV